MVLPGYFQANRTNTLHVKYEMHIRLKTEAQFSTSLQRVHLVYCIEVTDRTATGGGLHCAYFQPHYGPGVDIAPNGNEYQEYFMGVKATGP